MRFLSALILPALLCGAWAATAADTCQDKLTACAKTYNCTKKPDSKECKSCTASYESCAASEKTTRGSFRKTTGKK